MTNEEMQRKACDYAINSVKDLNAMIKTSSDPDFVAMLKLAKEKKAELAQLRKRSRAHYSRVNTRG